MKHIFSLNLKYSEFIYLNTQNTGNDITYLVDTQADISIIKVNSIHPNSSINTYNAISIRGVTDGIINSLGTMEDTIFIQDTCITHTFQVVPENFNIPSDGIIGKDFLINNKCTINYDDFSLSIPINNLNFKIFMSNGPEKNTIVIPPRSEVIRNFCMREFMQTQFADSQEIANGVFTAKSIIRSENPYIRVINTTSDIKIIKNPIITSQDLNNFHVYSINSLNQTDNERNVDLLNTIKQNTPKLYHEQILPLCSEFLDVFAHKNDTLTTNNFYQQKLRLTENTPVCVKNYRLPKYQKEEINTQVTKLLKNDLIEQSKSNYNSPLILVPKKSTTDKKSWRMCVDYSLLNKN